jgi:single-stranded-DNA-specific exonuclease
MAAGLSIAKENIRELRKRLNENTTLSEDDLTERINIDVPMPIYYVNEKLISQFDLLEPFGNGNKKPVFAEKDVEVLEARLVGANKNVLRLKIMDEKSGIMDGIKFNETGEFEDLIREKYGEEEAKKLFASRSKKVKINIVYYPTINEFNGRRSIQINIEDYCI